MDCQEVGMAVSVCLYERQVAKYCRQLARMEQSDDDECCHPLDNVPAAVHRRS